MLDQRIMFYRNSFGTYSKYLPTKRRFNRVLRLPLFSWLSLMAICVIYGSLAYRWNLFPAPLLNKAISGYKEFRLETGVDLPWGYGVLDRGSSALTVSFEGEGPQEGVNLVTRMAEENSLVVELVSLQEEVLHSWNLNWFDIWPGAEHLPDHIMPKSKPGTFIHGGVLLKDGSLVFNYEYCGMVRINKKGKVLWRLPYATHHSLHLAENGNLWACGLVFEENKDAINKKCQLIEKQAIVEVSTQGTVLNEWLVEDLILKSGLNGYLYLMKRECNAPQLLHLNDVEPVDRRDSASWFEEGDVLFSLRNVNTVFIFNRFTNKVRTSITGPFVAQHDPDVKNDSTITVFDNGHGANTSHIRKSRVVELNLKTGDSKTVVEGTEGLPFYSEKLGKHQWLTNGNLLVTSSQQGKAFEMNAEAEIVWEYTNKIDEEYFGYLIDVQRIPLEYAEAFQ